MASIYWPGYLLCTAADEVGGTGTTSSCSPGGAQGIVNDQTIYGYSWGGTSVGSPIFAGIVTLLNQYLGSSGGQGNINPTLYSLAATPSNGAFHSAVATNPSLTAGSDGAYCQPGTPAGQPAALLCPSSGANAGFLGFDASNFDPTTGYDLPTGLGSVDANNLAFAFAALVSDFSLAVTVNPSSTLVNQNVVWNGTLTALNGYSNSVTLSCTAGAPATCTIAPNPLTPTASFTVTVGSTTAGTFNFSIQGTDGTITHSQSVSLTVNPDFTLTNTGSTSATVLAGVPAMGYAFTVAPVSPATTFGGAVTFSCSFSPTDPTLTNSSCVFNPPSIAAGASGSPPVPVILTITTSGPNTAPVKAQQHRRADNRSPWLPLTLPIAGVVMVGLAGREVSRYSAIAAAFLALALLGVLIACGSSARVSVGVSPSSASLWPNDAADGWPSSTQAFTATVGGTKNLAVTWSITPSTAGLIDTNGNYTAPTIAAGLTPSVTITATSQADSTKSANATVTLKAATVPGVFNVTVTATEAGTPPTTHALSPVLAMTVQ